MRGCNVPGCERRHEARGYCQLHYQRLMRTGRLDGVRSESFVCGCSLPSLTELGECRRCHRPSARFILANALRRIIARGQWRAA
jgi:hypothetical protein